MPIEEDRPMATFSSDYSDFYKQYVAAFLGQPDVAAGPDGRYFVRPGQIVVHKVELPALEGPLEGAGFTRIPRFGYGPENEPDTRVPLPFAVYQNDALGKN